MAMRNRKAPCGRSVIQTYWYERLTSVLREFTSDKDIKIPEIGLRFADDCGRNSEWSRRAVSPDLEGVPLGQIFAL